uniref:Uncharacterized protein n=1 Tax=Mycena chlorophos TaxID=658473 RepID=A0ABQ0LN05_MYCCL|nr:predicted protein [Mycena chlorophos]
MSRQPSPAPNPIPRLFAREGREGSFSSTASAPDAWNTQLARRRPRKLVKAKRSFHRLGLGFASNSDKVPPIPRARKYSLPSQLPTVIVTPASASAVDETFKETPVPVRPPRSFHPGRLTVETYVFVLGIDAKGKQIFGPPTKIAMWNCCSEEPEAPGCAKM